MALFRDLTDEILVVIIDFIASLATVNQKLNGLATQLLACDVDIYVQTQDQALARRYDLLMSSLDRRPGLNICVRTITITCKGDSDVKDQRKKNANLRANELLKLLPNIKSLCIDWNDNRSTFVPDFLGETDRPSLKEVTIQGRKTTLDELCAYMSITSLSSISVKDLDTATKISPRCLQRTSGERNGANLSLTDTPASPRSTQDLRHRVHHRYFAVHHTWSRRADGFDANQAALDQDEVSAFASPDGAGNFTVGCMPG